MEALRRLRISRTMKKRKLDNFSSWRDRARKSGIIPAEYLPFKKDGDLAELIGVILGDGHIRKYARTEELSIFSNANNVGFVERYSNLVLKVVGKRPVITKHGKSDCTRIRIYQKHLQRRFQIPFSPRKNIDFEVPKWILRNPVYIVRYLRGLYEAEGSHSIHESTSTYKVFFSNRNTSLLKIVFDLVTSLGFHPHISSYKVQISKKKEVFVFLNLIQFRKY